MNSDDEDEEVMPFERITEEKMEESPDQKQTSS